MNLEDELETQMRAASASALTTVLLDPEQREDLAKRAPAPDSGRLWDNKPMLFSATTLL